MQLSCLSWYVCSICLLLALAASVITFVPEIEYLGIVMPIVFGGLAVATGGAAIALERLAPDHPLQRSMPLWGVILLVAVIATLMLLGIVG